MSSWSKAKKSEQKYRFKNSSTSFRAICTYFSLQYLIPFLNCFNPWHKCWSQSGFLLRWLVHSESELIRGLFWKCVDVLLQIKKKTLISHKYFCRCMLFFMSPSMNIYERITLLWVLYLSVFRIIIVVLKCLYFNNYL